MNGSHTENMDHRQSPSSPSYISSDSGTRPTGTRKLLSSLCCRGYKSKSRKNPYNQKGVSSQANEKTPLCTPSPIITSSPDSMQVTNCATIISSPDSMKVPVSGRGENLQQENRSPTSYTSSKRDYLISEKQSSQSSIGSVYGTPPDGSSTKTSGDSICCDSDIKTGDSFSFSCPVTALKLDRDVGVHSEDHSPDDSPHCPPPSVPVDPANNDDVFLKLPNSEDRASRFADFPQSRRLNISEYEKQATGTFINKIGGILRDDLDPRQIKCSVGRDKDPNDVRPNHQTCSLRTSANDNIQCVNQPMCSEKPEKGRNHNDISRNGAACAVGKNTDRSGLDEAMFPAVTDANSVNLDQTMRPVVTDIGSADLDQMIRSVDTDQGQAMCHIGTDNGSSAIGSEALGRNSICPADLSGLITDLVRRYVAEDNVPKEDEESDDQLVRDVSWFLSRMREEFRTSG